MSMTFEASSSVMLVFDFWHVHSPAGMLLSVLVVLLMTVFYELLKVSRAWLRNRSGPAPGPAPRPRPSAAAASRQDSSSALAAGFSESSLTADTPTALNRWLPHALQTGLHVLQVTLGYLLMLCVMSYNVWIFLGVVAGSALGYFIAFPLLGQV